MANEQLRTRPIPAPAGRPPVPPAWSAIGVTVAGDRLFLTVRCLGLKRLVLGLRDLVFFAVFAGAEAFLLAGMISSLIVDGWPFSWPPTGGQLFLAVFLTAWLAGWTYAVLLLFRALVRTLLARADRLELGPDNWVFRRGRLGAYAARSFRPAAIDRVALEPRKEETVFLERGTETFTITEFGTRAGRRWLAGFLAERLAAADAWPAPADQASGEIPEAVLRPLPGGGLECPDRSNWNLGPANYGCSWLFCLAWNAGVALTVLGALGLIGERPAAGVPLSLWLLVLLFAAIGIAFLAANVYGTIHKLRVREECWRCRPGAVERVRRYRRRDRPERILWRLAPPAHWRLDSRLVGIHTPRVVWELRLVGDDPAAPREELIREGAEPAALRQLGRRLAAATGLPLLDDQGGGA